MGEKLKGIDIMDITYERGHPVVWKDKGGEDEVPYWLESDEPVAQDEVVPCARCGELPTEEGHDVCIANMAGIANACCGHGTDRPYLQFEEDGPIFRLVVSLLQAIADGYDISSFTDEREQSK